MNEQANGQSHAPADSHGESGATRPAGFGDAPRFTVDKAKGKPGLKNEAVLGPFTIRDLTVFGSTLILFIASLIPMFAVRYNLWNLGSLFFLGLGILLPLIVSALFVARRVSPGTRMRIGSLSVDQFASVVASFAVAFFFLAVAGAYVPSMLLALVGALGLFVATVLARLVPYFAGDFLDRPETPAHVVARDTASPVRKPRAPKAPKEQKEAKEHQDGRTGAVAGWAQRMTSGGATATPGAATTPRVDEPHAAAANDSVPGTAAAPAGTAAPSAGSPAAAQSTPAPGHGATAMGAPATQISGVVPAAATAPGTAASATAAPSAAAARPAGAEPAAPSAAQQAGTPGVVQSAGNAAAVPAETLEPTREERQAKAAAAAEQTRAADVPAAAGNSAPTTVNPQVRSQEPIGATVDPASRTAPNQAQPVHEAFWFAVAQPRTAVDERTGAPAFVIEPGGWVLALEDRGSEFLVQHTDGRVGVLRDLSNIERG